MNTRSRLCAFLAGGVLLSSAATCGGSAGAPATAATTAAAPAAATVAARTVAPSPVAAQGVSHKAGTSHKAQPKRLESVVEIDMGDHYFGNAQGQKNPTFTLASGKTVGIHIHNEGDVLHEIVIGRNAKKAGDYEQTLTQLVESDVFFYYGETKAEVGGAMYGEIEMDQGLRDAWIRINVPANLKGEWEIGCFAPDHYEKGMHTKLLIQ